VPTPFYKRRSVQLVLGLAVSAACLAFAGWKFVADPAAREQLALAFQRADYSTLPAIWGVLFLFYWLKAWRWALLLSPVGKYAPLRELFPILMIGFSVNNLVPGHMGDVLRAALFPTHQGTSKTAALSTVILERVFDIIAILCYLGVGLIFVEGLSDEIRNKAYLFGGLALVALLGAVAYLVWTPRFVRLAEWSMNAVPILPVALRAKIAGMMETGAAGLSSLKSPRALAGIALTSLLQWGLNGMLVYLSIRSFGIALESPILVSCIVLGVVAFGVTIPSSPGYFGVVQICFSMVLDLFTDDQASVFAASIYYHMSQYIPVTITGLVFWGMKGFRLIETDAAPPTDASMPVAGAEKWMPVSEGRGTGSEGRVAGSEGRVAGSEALRRPGTQSEQRALKRRA
jgi:uncharacterized protein (TIRG00374 family)